MTATPNCIPDPVPRLRLVNPTTFERSLYRFRKLGCELRGPPSYSESDANRWKLVWPGLEIRWFGRGTVLATVGMRIVPLSINQSNNELRAILGR